MALFGLSKDQEKLELIRALIGRRMVVQGLIADRSMVMHVLKAMTDVQALGSIEAGIVTIVDTYTHLTVQGVDPRGALLQIERHRASLGTRRAPADLSLATFIAYRVEIEFDGHPALPTDHGHYCQSAAEDFLKEGVRRDRVTHAVRHAEQEVANTKARLWQMQHHLLSQIVHRYYEGELDENQFIDAVQPHLAQYGMEMQ